MKYKNKDLSVDEKAKIIGMLLEKSRQTVLKGLATSKKKYLRKYHYGNNN
jgi:hypothetical protein